MGQIINSDESQTAYLRRVQRWGKVNLFESDLSLADRCAARRQYRTFRLAMYAPQSSEYAKSGMYQGCNGFSRPVAKRIIGEFYRDLSWHTYIGEK